MTETKSAAPDVFVEAPKPKKRRRTRKGKPLTPGHAANEGVSDQLAVSQGEGIYHKPTPACAQYHTDVDKACRSFGEEAEIPVSSTDQNYQQHARLATRAGDAGSTHFPVPGEDPSAVKSALGTPPVNPLARAMQYMDAVSKGAAEWAADSAVRQPGTGHVAVGHSDLQQQPTYTSVLSRLQTVRGDLMGEYGPNLGGFSHAGNVTVNSLDAALAAGNYRGMPVVDHNPLRPDYHTARNSATAPNPVYPMGNPVSSNPPASKASKVDLMKSMLFPKG